MQVKEFSTYILMVATILVWGGTYVAGRTLDPALDNIVSGFWRMGIAFIALLIICGITKTKLFTLNRRMLVLQILLGLFGICVYTIFFHKGIQTVAGGRAAVIINTSPIFIALGATLFLKEKLTPLRAVGVLLAVAGAVIVVSHGHVWALLTDKLTSGDLYLLVAAIAWAVFALLGKAALQQGIKPLVSITWSIFFGLIFLFPIAYKTGHLWQMLHYRPIDWACIAYLGIFSTVAGFVWYYKIIDRFGATRTGILGSLIPVSAIIMTFIFLGEPLYISLVVGAIITMCGVVFANAKTR